MNKLRLKVRGTTVIWYLKERMEMLRMSKEKRVHYIMLSIAALTVIYYIYIPSKLATSCGIIFNELFTNAVKHGSLSDADILKGKKREVQASFFHKTANQIELRVSNNGIPYPEDVDFRNTDSLGLKHYAPKASRSLVLSELRLSKRISYHKCKPVKEY